MILATPGGYARGRRASFRSRGIDPRRESWGGVALGDGRRPVRRAALTFSLAASSCLLDAMGVQIPRAAARETQPSSATDSACETSGLPTPKAASIRLDHLKRFALCRMSSAGWDARIADQPTGRLSVHWGRASSRRAPGITVVMLPVARGFEFKLTSEADNVAIVRRALHSLLQPAGFSPDRVASITLATTEVCANVVRHAYPDGTRGLIRIEAAVGPDGGFDDRRRRPRRRVRPPGGARDGGRPRDLRRACERPADRVVERCRHGGANAVRRDRKSDRW